MSKDTVVVRKLSTKECWGYLSRTSFARLAYHLRGQTRIAPINYALDEDQRVIFRTAEGSKFYALQVEDRVALEIDDYDETRAYSVVIQGHVSEILEPHEIKEATVNLRPWVRTHKKHVLAITVDEITGREFEITPHGT